MAYIKVFPIPASLTIDDVEEAFEQFGEVQQTLFASEFGAQRTALVEFVQRRAAERALAFDGEQIGGTTVRVLRADGSGLDASGAGGVGGSGGLPSSPPSNKGAALFSRLAGALSSSLSASLGGSSGGAELATPVAAPQPLPSSVATAAHASLSSSMPPHVSQNRKSPRALASRALSSDTFGRSPPRIKVDGTTYDGDVDAVSDESDYESDEDGDEVDDDDSSLGEDFDRDEEEQSSDEDDEHHHQDEEESGSEGPTTTHINSQRIVWQGYLVKQGAIRKSWKRRYFILTGRRLRYYETKTADEPISTIHLDKDYCVETVPFEELRRQNCFKLAHPSKRSYYIQARSASQRDTCLAQWRHVLENYTPPGSSDGKPRIGKLIASGNEQSFELIYCMLAGIRHAVGRQSAQQLPPPTSDAFAEQRESIFRRDSANRFDFDFLDYSPVVFAHLRRTWRLDAADYLVSLTANYALSELLTPGKSGSFFYFSTDMRFLFKTVTSGEFKTLRQMLPSYYAHARRYASTLLPRFLGLHGLRRRGQMLRFVVMTNLFPVTADLRVVEQYDLKGSTVGRTAGAEKIRSNPTTVRKDLDFARQLHLPPRMALALQQQLSIDSEFLERHNVMDYSLLLGICPLSADFDEKKHSHSKRKTDDSDDEMMSVRSETDDGSELDPTIGVGASSDDERVVDADNLAALVDEMNDDSQRDCRSLFELFRGGVRARRPHREAYFCGIIDILQVYNLKKQLEHQFKATRFDATGVSVTHPHAYAARFRTFMSSIILHHQQQPIQRPSIVARNSNEGVQSGSEQPSTANQRHSSQRSLARSGVRPSRPTGNDLQNSSGRKKKVATIHAERSRRGSGGNAPAGSAAADVDDDDDDAVASADDAEQRSSFARLPSAMRGLLSSISTPKIERRRSNSDRKNSTENASVATSAANAAAASVSSSSLSPPGSPVVRSRSTGTTSSTSVASIAAMAVTNSASGGAGSPEEMEDADERAHHRRNSTNRRRRHHHHHRHRSSRSRHNRNPSDGQIRFSP